MVVGSWAADWALNANLPNRIPHSRWLALPRHFSDTGAMTESSEWQVPKWPFLMANAALLGVAAALIWHTGHPLSLLEISLATASVALGALLGCLPFVLEYRATTKLIEINAITTVAAQLHALKQYAAQVATATDQWARVQENTQGHADKTLAAARGIAERMTAEIQGFNDFQIKLNDTEKGALRLEVEKLRRAEAEWLQVVVRILDHIFALHTAATRSNQPDLAEQIGQFQNACREAGRRVGLTPFAAGPAEKFDAQRHRAHGVENPPAEAVVAETLAPGISFQGRLVRLALVRLLTEPQPVGMPTTPAKAAPEPTETMLTASAELPLGTV
jgi:molecular chaperone GrpE (heat shock protein)